MRTDLASIGQAFGVGLTGAVWGYQKDLSHSFLRAVADHPVVVRAELVDQSGILSFVVGAKNLPGNQLSERLPLIKTHRDGRKEVVGELIVSSDQLVVLGRVKSMFLAIIGMAAVKAVALWMIVVLVAERYLGDPLRHFTTQIERITGFRMVPSSTPQVDLGMVKGADVKYLRDAFNQLMRRLNKSDTRRRHAEQIEREKSNFLAMVGHDLKAPLSVILGTADLMRSDAAAQGNAPEQVMVVKDAASGLVGLVDDLMDLARIDAGNLPLAWIPFSPREVTQEVVAMVSGQCQSKGLKVAINVEDDVPSRVGGDRGRLRRILVNFITNAVKFTDRGEVKVTLKCIKTSGDIGIRFCVTDSGIGVPKEFQGQMFDPFSRAETDSDRHDGTGGLGLTICKALATAMGGDVGYSERPGNGSLFYVDLPFDTVAECSMIGPQSPKNILLVDDVPVVCEIGRRQLEAEGHSVVTVTSGPDCLAAAAENIFDLILIDIHMPGMDGYQTVQELRLHTERVASPVTTPVFALTDGQSEILLSHCLDAGFDGVLSKPLKLEDLARKLELVLQPKP